MTSTVSGGKDAPIKLATFDEPRTGVLKIVVKRNKLVRIDGLGVVTAP